MKFVVVLGARPNVIKAAPVIHELERKGHYVVCIHTGQHYDDNMFNQFLFEFQLNSPSHFLGASDPVRTTRLAEIIDGIGTVLRHEKPDACIVVGDVDSTLGGALAAHMTGTKIIHLESGLRSFDWTMPEENNRIIVDKLSDILLTTTEAAVYNLKGYKGYKSFVGNTLIDSLMTTSIPVSPIRGIGYVLCTFHRPSLIDNAQKLNELADALEALSETHSIYIVAHPRLLKAKASMGNIGFMTPRGYGEFVSMMMGAKVIITDSGGVQEETSALHVPCITYRENTERPITISKGTNFLCGMDPEKLIKLVNNPLKKPEQTIPLWDGLASIRAVKVIEEKL